MKHVFVLGLAALLTATAIVAYAATEPDPLFQVQRLTERVWVFTEQTPWECNHVVIDTADGLVLVDPGHTPLMARLIRKAVGREIGRDRFAYVIDTHGHWGHTWGNAGFPDAVVIGHENAAETMRADVANLDRRIDVMRAQLVQAATRLGELDPASDEAASVELERDHFERIVRGLEEPGFRVRPPDLVFSDRLGLDLGDLRLEMTYLGPGHSDSDITILVPEERVLLIGCFFLDRDGLPYFGIRPQLDPDRWLQVFDSFLADETAIDSVVLGQHAIWSRDQLAVMRDYIASLWSEANALDDEGVDFETALSRIPSPSEFGVPGAAQASQDDLQQMQIFEFTALWRQLKDSAAAEVEQSIETGGAAAGIARYREMNATDDPRIFFDEAEFNMLGYRLLGQGRVDDAIAVFQLNVDRYPDSWNVYDSLGEAWATKGDVERAIELYRHSVQLNPDNTNGIDALERLQAELSAMPSGD